jgi:hypothetical protein
VTPLTHYSSEPNDDPAGVGHPAQEAHMRRALSIVAVAALISVVLLVVVAPSKTVADIEATKGGFHHQISIHGLHVSLPDEMKDFPIDLVPLP